MMVIPNRGRVVAVMLALALAGGLLTLVLLAKPSQAQPPADNEHAAVSEEFQQEFTIDGTGCSGELINFEGTMHVVENSFPVDGGYHFTVHFNFTNMKGVGIDPVTLEPTGTEYVFTRSSTTVENFVPAGDIVSSNVDSFLATGKGQVRNEVGFVGIHYILTAEGELKVETIQFHLECH
jgi:hypothetical protein